MISFLILLISACLFTGLLGRFRSIMAGRKGPGILQPLKNILVLLKKGSVYSQTSSIIFRLGPVVLFSSTLAAAMLVPVPGQESLISFSYDFIFFAYLLALGRFFLIIAALDTGSPFEGMGAAREAFYSMLIEPAFFILLGTLTLLTGYSSFSDIFQSFPVPGTNWVLAGVLGAWVLGTISLVENARVPVDDPRTHLELTMIHEVMILDHSGFDLALIHLSNWIKFAVFGSLIANCLIPTELDFPVKITLYLLIQIVFAGFIAVIESFRARNRLNKNAQFILSASTIALIAFIMILILNR